MSKNYFTLETINSSIFGVLAKKGNADVFLGAGDGEIEIERIEKRNEDNLLLSVRVRNASSKSIKIFSFIVADFCLPQEYFPKKILEHGWLQCSEVCYKTLDGTTEQNTVFLKRDQNPFSFKEEYGYLQNSTSRSPIKMAMAKVTWMTRELVLIP